MDSDEAFSWAVFASGESAESAFVVVLLVRNETA